MATGTNPNNMNNANADSKTEFQGFKMPSVDMNAIMDSYKKNLEILGLINKMSVEVCNGIAKLQSAFIKQMMIDFGSVVEKSGKPSDAISKLSEVTRDSIVKAIGNGKQISDIIMATSNELTSAITKRFKESIEEAKNIVQNGK